MPADRVCGKLYSANRPEGAAEGGRIMPHIDLASEGGRQIPVEYRLPADARRVCIIAHGFASSKESATAQMMLDHLEKLGLGAFAFDFPCHGESSAPWQQLTVDACLADLRQVEAFARTSAAFSSSGLNTRSATQP